MKTFTVKIPAGTQSGQILKLRGKGMTIVRSSIRGDMMVHAIVETPVITVLRNISFTDKSIKSDIGIL